MTFNEMNSAENLYDLVGNTIVTLAFAVKIDDNNLSKRTENMYLWFNYE